MAISDNDMKMTSSTSKKLFLINFRKRLGSFRSSDLPFLKNSTIVAQCWKRMRQHGWPPRQHSF